MNKKESAQEVIENYKKKQQWGPFVFGALAVLLVVVGVFVVVFWLTGDQSKPLLPFLASKTPTPTNTATPTPVTPTNTPTETPTETPTPTITLTPTASGPFEVVVQENDTCYDLAERYNTNLAVLIKLNEPQYGPNCLISVGAKVLIPPPGAELPTPTPVDLTQLVRGYIFRGYAVQQGEILSTIAEKFNSTVDAILKQNKLTDPNNIFLGQLLDIPVNIVTPVPTQANTSTPTGTLPATAIIPTGTATP